MHSFIKTFFRPIGRTKEKWPVDPVRGGPPRHRQDLTRCRSRGKGFKGQRLGELDIELRSTADQLCDNLGKLLNISFIVILVCKTECF